MIEVIIFDIDQSVISDFDPKVLIVNYCVSKFAMDQPTSQTTITPHSQKPLVTRVYPSESELNVLIQNSATVQKEWSRVPLQERIAIGRKFMASLLSCRIPAKG
jgi:delta 1-pyrroline-5-carboxylate dehydrogenase